jgi:hypothetical protein
LEKEKRKKRTGRKHSEQYVTLYFLTRIRIYDLLLEAPVVVNSVENDTLFILSWPFRDDHEMTTRMTRQITHSKHTYIEYYF